MLRPGEEKWLLSDVGVGVVLHHLLVPSPANETDVIFASFVHLHQVKKVPAHDPVVLQEETGAEVGAIFQEDDVLRVVGSQGEEDIEDGFNLVIANQREQGTQGSPPALLLVRGLDL